MTPGRHAARSAGPAGRPATPSCSATGRCGRTAASPAGPTRRWRSATPACRCRTRWRRRVRGTPTAALPPLLQLPLADPANQAMADDGWPRLHVTVVQVAPIAAVLARGSTQRRPARHGRARRRRSDWRSLMHDLDADDPEAHVAILTGPDRSSASRPSTAATSRSASAGSRSRASGPASRRWTSRRRPGGRASARAVMARPARLGRASRAPRRRTCRCGRPTRRRSALRRARLRHPPPVRLPRAGSLSAADLVLGGVLRAQLVGLQTWLPPW